MERSTPATFRYSAIGRAPSAEFFRPVKKQLTLRLDADLIEWFKTHRQGGEGYQTSINKALREHVARHRLD